MKFFTFARTTTPERERNADEHHHLKAFREAPLLAKQQHAEAPGARQHTADGGGDAELDEQRDENQSLVQSSAP